MYGAEGCAFENRGNEKGLEKLLKKIIIIKRRTKSENDKSQSCIHITHIKSVSKKVKEPLHPEDER